jgi:hypothetical protein
MLIIENLAIVNNGKQLLIKTNNINSEYYISSITLWTTSNFKNYSLGINLPVIYNEDRVLNFEWTFNAEDIGLSKFEDIIFIEINHLISESNTPSDYTLGATYNLSPYYECLFKYLVDISENNCSDCEDNGLKDIIISINLMIDNIKKAIDIGYYMQAIELIKNLKKICSSKKCNNCPPVECVPCNSFSQIYP